jgi:phosphatidylethanolamine/phosphatidyl-N-methylethanolamine N-methyltransferase
MGSSMRTAVPLPIALSTLDRGCMWNRLRYTLWAPWYDALIRAATDFDAARRRSIDALSLEPGHRVLLAGAGTGLDLPFLPRDVRVTAIDVAPAMLARLRRRAASLRLHPDVRTMDARDLGFEPGAFDAVVLHLVLSVMPEPERGLREAERVLRPGGRVSVFDKFLRDEERPSAMRRLGNVVVKALFSDLNRRLGPIVATTSLAVERDEPAAFGGLYRSVTLRKSASCRDVHLSGVRPEECSAQGWS